MNDLKERDTRSIIGPLPASQLDLEPSWEEIYVVSLTDRFVSLYDVDDLYECDILCIVENTLRRERGVLSS